MLLSPIHLRVNDVTNPIGISGVPYFGWYNNALDHDEIQTRCQVLVASSQANIEKNIADVWDSGAITSRDQNHIEYNGKPLNSNHKYFWKIRVWDKAGKVSPDSESGTFVTGLLKNSDWAGAKWIRRETEDSDDYTYYRKTFSLANKTVTRAMLFIATVHKYELYLNGDLIGKGPSYHYPQYQYYNAYDVTTHIAPNVNNTLAILNHWFGPGQGRPQSERGLIVKAIIEYADGTSTVIGSDASWKQKRADCWIGGQEGRGDEGVGYIEKIDAANLIPDWYTPTYDDSQWDAATEIGAHPTPPWTGELNPDLSRIVEYEIKPHAITHKGGGVYVVDLGKVYPGRVRITFEGGEVGTIISMQAGFTLTAEGLINPKTNQNTDLSFYAVTHGGTFTFLPMEYFGMRYFQVNNSPIPITAENFSFIVRHAALDDSRSAFTSSNSILNDVWDLMKYSIHTCAQEQFIDTPTREKGGFLLDSALESLAAMPTYGERVLTLRALNEFLHSMDHYWSSEANRGRLNAVYPNGDGARDIPDFTQAYLGWAWEYYLQSGDKKFLRDNYVKLKSLADFVHKHRDETTGLIHNLTGGGGPYLYGIVDWPATMRYGYDMATEARTVINAYAYNDYDLVSKIADELGNNVDRDIYRAMADDIKTAINNKLLSATNVYVDGLDASGVQSMHVSQQANIFPLALGLVPTEKLTSVVNKVKELKMSVGMVTVWWLLRALGEMDEGAHLIDLYTQPSWNGWAQTLAKGATSTWESWDADTNGQSLSHAWGAIGLVGIQQYVLGVKPLAPQYEKVQIKPLSFDDKLTSASGTLPTDRGDITVRWERSANHFSMTITLPANMQAKVYVPKMNIAGEIVVVDGESKTGSVEGNYIAFDSIGSGTHTFEQGGDSYQ